MYLQIKQLNKSYGSRRVVSNVDLSMEEGEILSLLGPSGCGKTTILRMIAGLVSPESGWINIGDRVMYDGRREVPVEERRLGMVFQDYALWPHMTLESDMVSLHLKKNSSEELIVVGLVSERVRDRLNGNRAAQLLCRPDDIRVYRELPELEHANVLPGKVSHTSFVGGRWRTLVTPGDIGDVPAVLAFPSFQPQIEQQVWLELPPDRCQVVTE